MKSWVLLISIIATASTGFLSSGELLQKTIKEHSLDLQSEEQLRMTEMEETSKVSALSIAYKAYKLVDIPKARTMMVHLVRSLIDKINANEMLADEVHPFPVEVKQLNIVIHFDHAFGEYVDPLYMKAVTLIDGTITYHPFLNEALSANDYEHQETFSQAEYALGMESKKKNTPEKLKDRDPMEFEELEHKVPEKMPEEMEKQMKEMEEQMQKDVPPDLFNAVDEELNELFLGFPLDSAVSEQKIFAVDEQMPATSTEIGDGNVVDQAEVVE